MKIPKVRTTDYRKTARPASDPPSARQSPPLERTARPGAAACHKPTSHEIMLEGASDTLIAGVIADAEKRNLRDYGNHETRWWAERSSTARAIRRARKEAGKWTIPTHRKAA